MSEFDNLKDKSKKFPIKIHLEESEAGGRYTNLTFVNFNQNEFVLDFIFIEPQEPKGKVVSRVITSPRHAKALIAVLAENLRRYEEKYGKIEIPKNFPVPIQKEGPYN